ncbi:hypothetical protein EJB05_20792, partial [Eragrostis curvula]
MEQLFIRYIDAGDKSSMSEQPVKLTMAMLFTLLFSVRVGNIHCSTLGDNSTDMIWLLDFRKAITNDPDGILNSWNISTPFCEWKGVSCSRKHPGRVTALDLRDQGLFGKISPSLGNLTFLKKLNLSANRLSGVLPPFSRLGKLQFLSLTDNLLEGDIPDGLTNCSNLMVLALSRNMLVGEIPRKLSLLSNLKMLGLNLNNLSGVIPPMLNKTGLEFLALSDNQLGGGIIPDGLDEFLKVSYMDLAKATRNFSESNMIGRGSYGAVYRAKLTKVELDVAVKIFDLDMQVDTRGNHFKALIYEFMPRADALDYLHNGTERSVIHCDLKPTNILLDNDMIARLGDFGIASVLDNSKPIPIGESCSYNSIIPNGTIGYIAPGKRPTDPIFKDDLNIVNFVEKSFPDHIWQVVDAHIQRKNARTSLKR